MNAMASQLATITPYTLPDNLGRQEFMVDWVSPNGRRRGQMSFAIIEETVRYFRDAGYEVHISEVAP